MEWIASRALNYIKHKKFMKKCMEKVDIINRLENELQKLTDDELRRKTEEFRNKLQSQNVSLDDILPEAFATVREASVRVLGIRPFDVQLIGGMILHSGSIAEMKTGEGKTLCAILPAYLNALSGIQVHIITVNDYLATTHAEEMEPLYTYLGLTVGAIHSNADNKEELYTRDILYIEGSENVFQYLRDMMKFDDNFMVKRGYKFAIVDEADSVMIDEARNPFIISGEPEYASVDMCIRMSEIIHDLDPEDYVVNEKLKYASFTDKGFKKLEDILSSEYGNIFSVENINIMHHANQALRAGKLMRRDIDYIVRNGEVLIVGEGTGRVMDGRRYSDGLHQAIEAKEKVKIEPENKTIASITYQNFFKLYDKLSGMTGTAMTEASEFSEIYNVDVYEVPTNKPVIRKDDVDSIFPNGVLKTKAIVEMVQELNSTGQPILIGTISVEESEYFSEILSNIGIKHNVLNARHHGNEAKIIAEAGKFGAVTIATSMAGRGTDIKLGGKDESDKERIVSLGGLCVICTQRHENRRIDNQFRGRSGRQGDPGYTKFFVSPDDYIIVTYIGKISIGGDKPITSSFGTKMIALAQSSIGAMNFESKKNTLKYDDVSNAQRKVIYDARLCIIRSKYNLEDINYASRNYIYLLLDKYLPAGRIDEWDTKGLSKTLKSSYGINIKIDSEKSFEEIEMQIISACTEKISEAYSVNSSDEDFKRIFSREILSHLDHLWKNNVHNLEQVRSCIHLESYGQKDPFQSYQIIAYDNFKRLIDDITQYIVDQYIIHAIEYAKNIKQVIKIANINNMSIITFLVGAFIHALKDSAIEVSILSTISLLKMGSSEEKIINKVKKDIDSSPSTEFAFMFIIRLIKKISTGNELEDTRIIMDFLNEFKDKETDFIKLISNYRINRGLMNEICNISVLYAYKYIKKSIKN